jgi:hypothetical protein
MTKFTYWACKTLGGKLTLKVPILNMSDLYHHYLEKGIIPKKEDQGKSSTTTWRPAPSNGNNGYKLVKGVNYMPNFANSDEERNRRNLILMQEEAREDCFYQLFPWSRSKAK